jgi:hypothetical protein
MAVRSDSLFPSGAGVQEGQGTDCSLGRSQELSLSAWSVLLGGMHA